MKILRYTILSFFLTLLIFGLFLARVPNAKAVGDAYFPQDTTVGLNIGNFTITAGSDADTVVTTSNNITVTISNGQSFTLKSSSRKELSISGSYTSLTCTDNESSVVITPSLGDSQRTVVITPQSVNCTNVGGGSSGGGGGSVTSVPSSTPAPTTTPVSTPLSTPTTTPVSSPAPTIIGSTPVSRGFVSLVALSLQEGDVVSAVGSDDPDVYIVNSWGYKRLFLNPAIFKFYGHLGGFAKIKNTPSLTRDTFVTSGLFRNCETNDKKVYGVETTGEDSGLLHWVNTTGEQAVADDPEFFKKVFCINSKEFSWYKQGTPYTSVKQIPAYSRKTAVSVPVVPAVTIIAGKLKVVSSVGWLNVRDQASLNGKIIGKVLSNQQFNFVDIKDGWYNIQKDGKDFGWVFGKYVAEI